MRRLVVALIVAGPVVAVLVGVIILRNRTPATQPLPAGSLKGDNVLLVTIDTLRADHVGAYGADGEITPNIDALAHEGLRFDRTYAHVPLTLPSHTTLMTASYPPRNGVRDNGTFRLGDRSPTLAAVLEAAGYRTGAFVGAFILDARFGLNRGFQVYDDRMMGSSADLEVVQRTAEQVLAPAYDWITSTPAPSTPAPSTPAPSTQHPWFAWVHLYDPHEPYAPPEPYRTRYASEPYDGEIAYTDAALGLFIGRLRAAHALDRTLVVITSDHGESLGEHGERTHGLFAYDATLRVPLVMWAPDHIRSGAFDHTMRLVDVAPTVLDLLGLPALAGVDGRSVRPFVSGERPFDSPGSYFEALNANLTRNWAPLTGLVRQQLKVIDLPIPELYDLSSDPREQHNLYASERDRARDLEARLDQVTRGAPSAAPSPIDPDADARLKALGYVVAPAVKPAHAYGAADDPKTLVHLNQSLDDAAALWSKGESERAIAVLRGVVKERPDLTIAYDRLAYILRASGQPGEAVSVLDEAAHGGHADRSLLLSLGAMLRDTGDAARSAAVLEPLVSADPSDLHAADALGQTYVRMARMADAEALFKRVLAASPNAAATWNNLGALYLIEEHTADAAAALERAVAVNPELATAHNALGVVRARQGDMAAAIAEWQRALALRPDYPDAQANLARARQ